MSRPGDPSDAIGVVECEARVALMIRECLYRAKLRRNALVQNVEKFTRKPSSLIKILDVPP
jgi:hypothetical protein